MTVAVRIRPVLLDPYKKELIMWWLVLVLWLLGGMSVFGCTKDEVCSDRRWVYALFCLVVWPFVGFYELAR